MRTLLKVLFFFLLAAQICFTQDNYSENMMPSGPNSDASAAIDSASLDSVITAFRYNQSGTGIATMIVKSNQVIWNKNYGYRNVQSQLPVEDSTIFLLASISKPVVVTAVMQLWENGLIDLEKNINTYLPAGFTVKNPFYPDDTITVKMLMTHTSTITDANSEGFEGCGDYPMRLDSFLVKYLIPGGIYYHQNNYLNKHPGQQWQYSNVGNSLLAVILEHITGKSFDQYCRDSIFVPLSMNSTSWFLRELDTNQIAVPYEVFNMPLCHGGCVLYPSGALRSNKLDLLKFLSAYINNGIYNNYRMLDSATITYMLSDKLGYNIVWETPWWKWNQGLIWWNVFPISPNSWGHAGVGAGCFTYMCFDPIEKWGTIWLQNWLRSFNNYTPMGQVNAYLTGYAHIYIIGIPGVDEQFQEIPSEFSLSQNYPNPFNPGTVVSYQLSVVSRVTLKIYDALGREVETLVNEEKSAGTYEIKWDAENLPSGVYFYQLKAGDFIQTKKMILMK